MRKPWHSRAALLALLALVLQLAVPLWHVPPAMAAALCAAHAPMDAVPGNAEPGLPQPGKSCPICQVAHTGGTGMLPAPAAVAVPVEFSYVLFLPPADGRVIDPAAPTPSTRGPPAA